MSELPHLRIEGTAKAEKYTSTQMGRGNFDLPPRNPSTHPNRIRADLTKAKSEAEQLRDNEESLVSWQPNGFVLAFTSDPGYELKLDSLNKRGQGIHVVSLCIRDDCQVAKVFVPYTKIGVFFSLLDEYIAISEVTYLTKPGGEAKLIALANDAKKIKFLRPTYSSKDENKNPIVKVRFSMPVAEVPNFKSRADKVGKFFDESRKNYKLIDSIASVRLTIIQDFWQERTKFPAPDKDIWWEIWLRGTRERAEEIHETFVEVAQTAGIQRVSDRFVAFPERVVIHAFTNAKTLSHSPDILAAITELWMGKELSSHYMELKPRDQAEYIALAVKRLKLPGKDAPCVTVIDGGVHRAHQLLEPALAEKDCHAAVKEWGVSDNSNQHGTQMAGIALYGCLTEVLKETDPIVLRHRLESVKIIPPTGKNEPPDYARRMQDAAALVQVQAPKRNRALCMAVTADRSEQGAPSLWSAAVDDLCAGRFDGSRKLMFISVGNIREQFDKSEYVYHEWNTKEAAVEDPAQSWNAITVGAITEKDQLSDDPSLDGWTPMAQAGDLCPTSRTSLPWTEDRQAKWPIKPDIVMEGGNYLEKGKWRMSCDDLSLLTTYMHQDGRRLETIRDTSPATAAASRFAAMLWSRYPHMRPETIRALMVHSARWNKRMRERFKGRQKSTIHELLRCYGYGIPDFDRACHSAENAVTLIYEGELQPFIKPKGKPPKTNHMHIHTLPWPVKALEDLEENKVQMRVTLSYYIEPSPGGVGWQTDHRYQSHGLRFETIRLFETMEEFKKRLSKAEWEDPAIRPETAEETRNWVIGPKGRTHGSIHSDWWIGKGAELAVCNKLAIFPVTGWWKERAHQGRHDEMARYSLVISLETKKTDVDLYTPITNFNTVETETMV